MNDVATVTQLDTTLSDLLTEVVVYCDQNGRTIYANPTAQHWFPNWQPGTPFITLLHPEVQHKGEAFLAAVKEASSQHPTPLWELAFGHDTNNYTVATFRGYCQNSHMIIIGQAESSEVSDIQKEMVALTSELSQAQRDLRRQNRSLQQLLEEQQQLVQTIQELTAPAVPVWDHVLLLPLVGHIDAQRATKITEDLLQHVSTTQAEYVIVDMSGIAVIDTNVAEHLVSMARSLRLLGAIPILVGINPTSAETIVHLGIELNKFYVYHDVHHAIAFVLRQFKG